MTISQLAVILLILQCEFGFNTYCGVESFVKRSVSTIIVSSFFFFSKFRLTKCINILVEKSIWWLILHVLRLVFGN